MVVREGNAAARAADEQHPPTASRSRYSEPEALVALVGPERADWYRRTPEERWRAAEALWQTFTDLGGTLDVEPDSQSPFYAARSRSAASAHGRAGVHHLRRRGV
jgi:hypothetical protein